MGRGIAQVFALAGYSVNLYDAFPEVATAAPEKITSDLSLSVGSGLIELGQAATALKAITPQTELGLAVRDSELVIECAPEKMELKQAIFKELDELCPPEAILASNTSVMSITEIGSQAANKMRVIGTHFWNPPHLIPLVEVVQTEITAPWAIEKTMEILLSAGKKPIHVKKDVPGFVANRMQHALWREAFHILDEGIADAATIDQAVRYGFGLRLPQLGPMENADLVGLDLTLNIHDYILKFLASGSEPSKTLRQKVAEGQLGFKGNGQGFQTWSEDEMAKSRENLAKYLLNIAVAKKNRQ
jgi:3-hydroxybutyryl-CoA dehydrogenase